MFLPTFFLYSSATSDNRLVAVGLTYLTRTIGRYNCIREAFEPDFDYVLMFLRHSSSLPIIAVQQYAYTMNTQP